MEKHIISLRNILLVAIILTGVNSIAQRPKVYLGATIGVGPSYWAYQNQNIMSMSYELNTRIIITKGRGLYGMDVGLNTIPKLKLNQELFGYTYVLLKAKLGILPIKKQHIKLTIGGGINAGNRLHKDKLEEINETSRLIYGELEVFTELFIHNFSVGVSMQLPFGSTNVDLNRMAQLNINLGCWF
jgi:hypothetical protein